MPMKTETPEQPQKAVYLNISGVPQNAVFVDAAGIQKMFLMGTTLLYENIKNQGFPLPYQVGKRAVRWKLSEILEWFENQPRGLRSTPMDKLRGN